MKKSEIKKLTVGKFEDLLNEEMWQYVNDEMPSFERALEIYQEGAELANDGEDNYLDVNEYFKLLKEQQEDYESENESRYEE
jgi:hypothetical protein